MNLNSTTQKNIFDYVVENSLQENKAGIIENFKSGIFVTFFIRDP